MAIPEHSQTKSITQSIVDQLASMVGTDLAVEFYPEKPASYRLNHANGALLVNYAKSNYPKHDDTAAIIKPRQMGFTVTIISRGLHDRYGAVPLVDWVLAMLSGYRPEHTDKTLAPVRDYFIQHQSGLWYYGVDFDVEAVHVQALPINEI